VFSQNMRNKHKQQLSKACVGKHQKHERKLYPTGTHMQSTAHIHTMPPCQRPRPLSHPESCQECGACPRHQCGPSSSKQHVGHVLLKGEEPPHEQNVVRISSISVDHQAAASSRQGKEAFFAHMQLAFTLAPSTYHNKILADLKTDSR